MTALRRIWTVLVEAIRHPRAHSTIRFGADGRPASIVRRYLANES